MPPSLSSLRSAFIHWYTAWSAMFTGPSLMCFPDKHCMAYRHAVPVFDQFVCGARLLSIKSEAATKNDGNVLTVN